MPKKRTIALVFGLALFVAIVLAAVRVLDESTSMLDLHQAVAGGDVEEVRALLDAGLDPNMRDATGETMLHRFAAMPTRNLGTARLLVARGAEIDAQNGLGTTPLMEAVRRQRWDYVNFLLNEGADVTVRNANGDTALQRAVAQMNAPRAFSADEPPNAPERVRAGLVERLLDLGADPNVTDEYDSSLIAVALRNEDLETMRILLEHGADVNHKGAFGSTALHYAAMGGYDEAVDILLEAGADPTLTDDSGKTPRQHALQAGHRELAAKLEAH